MNEPSQPMMSNPIPPQVMSHNPQLMMNQPPPQVQILSQQPPPPPPPQLMNQNPQIMSQSRQFMMNQQQPQMMKRNSYGMWPPPRHNQTSIDMMKFPKNPMKQQQQQGYPASKPRNWKGKKGNNSDKRKEKPVLSGNNSGSGGGGGGGGYQPPTLNELQHQNRMKARKFYPNKKKYNNRFAPYAPRNTTSFIIRAKKSGGIASLVSPCPVTPAVLPTPIFSPSREVLGDMAKEEWGVDGYGSMKGLIRLRSPGNDEEEEEVGSSESDVEEHVEVERRLDHDLSRFEMIYPSYGGDYNNVLENRVDDQDSHIAQLEEENLILKERLFLMEREFGDLRRRLQCLERRNGAAEGINDERINDENHSENESEGNNDEVVEENNEEGGEEVDAKEQHNIECVKDVCMEEFVNARSKDEGVGNDCEEKRICGDEGVSMEEGEEEDEDEDSNAHGEVAAEDQSKDEGVGNGSSEKSIGDGDLSNCPVLM